MSTYPYANPPFRKRWRKLFFLLLVMGVLFFLWALSAVWSVLDSKGVLSGPRIGLVRVEGFIGDAERTVEWIEKLRKNPSVAGVLVRVDSPGGAVAPSQELHAALKRLAKDKPVVVSMGTAAASGGYYLAVAATEIFANPSTLTGSIGVRLQVTNVQGLMERIGVVSESLTTGMFKASGSPFKAMTPDERRYLQELLEDMQAEFVDAVAVGRNLSKDVVAPLADGRIYTGRQALDLKLVDALGDREAAIGRLAALCNLEKYPEILEQPEKPRSWWRSILEAALDVGAETSGETSKYQFVY